MEASAIVYGITMRYKREIPEPGEIADMLRYDLAFHDPGDPGRVVFPIFTSRESGTTSPIITEPRWHSFGCKIDDGAREFVTNLGEWITYRHPLLDDGRIDYFSLRPVTLDEFLAQNPKMKVHRWR